MPPENTPVQPSLFGAPPARSPLAEKLHRLSREGIWIGASSWKYEGWLGQIYTRERYTHRGKFSKRKFENECLAEYAETFPAVGGDFSFYQFPSDAFWHRLFASAPRTLRFAFKVPEEITAKVFPAHARYAGRAGKPNENFLNADLFTGAFLHPLAPFREQVAALILEFGTFSKAAFAEPAQFFEALDPFLASLPPTFRYSVEIRNPEYLGPDYFELLRRHRTAHVFNAWTRMPEVGTQIELPGAFPTDFSITRALLRRGKTYERAVEEYSPYEKVKEEAPEVRQALRNLIAKAKKARQEAYIFVNNRLEGNAPSTVEAVVG